MFYLRYVLSFNYAIELENEEFALDNVNRAKTEQHKGRGTAQIKSYSIVFLFFR